MLEGIPSKGSRRLASDYGRLEYFNPDFHNPSDRHIPRKNLTVFGTFLRPLLMGLFFLQKNLKKIPNCRKLNSTSDFQYIKSIILCKDGQKGLFIQCKINLTIRLLFIFLLYKYKAYELILHYA